MQSAGPLTKTNDAYAWGSHYNINRAYGTNGLNQLTSAGATALGYACPELVEGTDVAT
ncbi:hypothetical protein [Sphingorhabdus profundilacus]|uniref:hypothetical protein n=1 Tax=Sphingorhabdus profundilacus TaxID=2509718 RepID=UPI001366095A|nr:hypothetical protein [Sphingorhabdus profundilacus]